MRSPVALLACMLLLPACDEPLHPQSSGGVALPSLPLCDPARTWTQEAIDLELAIADRIAEVRETGFSCGAAGTFDPAPALRRSGRLICAARLHSLDMAVRGFVDHENPDDVGPWERLRAVDYEPATADEAIAAGPLSADDVLDDAWLVREGSCAAILADPYVHFGVGVHVDEASEHGRYFTLLLGKPP
jgi:uncharacterized protein YkwD